MAASTTHRFAWLACFSFLPWALVGCCPTPGPAPNATLNSRPDAGNSLELTLLYTADEHGWLVPSSKDTPARGGLVQLFGQLLHEEGHCVGSWPGEPRPNCSQAKTLLLSGGDNFTGPALSSFFRGRTTAEVMRLMGYSASAFGNHELDFGRRAFVANRALTGLPYLAANIVEETNADGALTQAYVVVERGGVRVGIVGVATPDTPNVAARHRFETMTFEAIESALSRTVPEVWAQQVDMVVVVAHECAPHMREVLARHPEWRLSFVGVGHCHRMVHEEVNGTPLIMPDWRGLRYARVRIVVDRDKPAKQRATVVSHEVIEVHSRQPATASEVTLEARMATWQAELTAALGAPIGYTRTGLGKHSRKLWQLILRAWHEDARADLAVTTRGGIRQSLPAGVITRAEVLGVLPFDNNLVVCSVPGEVLGQLLEGSEVLVYGAHKDDHGKWRMADGAALDPERRYRIVTTDFLYHGGDKMPFADYDKTPQHTKRSWRQPVIRWFLNHNTTPENPLEKLIP